MIIRSDQINKLDNKFQLWYTSHTSHSCNSVHDTMTQNTLLCLFISILALVAVHESDAKLGVDPTCETGKYPPESKEKLPWQVVDLDLPPTERWNLVLKDKAPAMRHLIDEFKKFIVELMNGSTALIDIVDTMLVPIVDSFQDPFPDELRGISKATGIPLGEVVLYNIFYEVFSVCTSIIAQDTKGKYYHVRNLDFGLFLGWNAKNHTWKVTEALRPALVNLKFQRGGQTVFLATNYAGYVGILTGLKPRTFTLTIDERFALDGGYMGIINWILGDRKSEWLGFLTRRVLENATSFDDARELLSNTPMLAPAYFILAGNQSKQACVITRSRQGAVDTWNMHEKTEDTWFILETNYDHWQKPLFLDDRRTTATNCTRKMTQQNVGFEGLYNVLSTKPVRNKLTTYTALMQVNSARYESFYQYCPDPCDPW